MLEAAADRDALLLQEKLGSLDSYQASEHPLRMRILYVSCVLGLSLLAVYLHIDIVD